MSLLATTPNPPWGYSLSQKTRPTNASPPRYVPPLPCRHRQPLTSTQTRQILPTELIVTVSQFLSATDALGSVARLNRISRAVHEETLRVLYETVMWDGKGGCVSEGWRYTR